MKRPDSGLTMIELIVTVAIAGILAAVATPSLSTMIKNNRLTTNINDLMIDLALARSEAAKRGVRVTVCVSSSGSSCSGTNWTNGRIVFVDRGTAGTVDGGDEILRVTSGLTSSNTLTTPAAFANAGYVQYRSKGMTDSTGTFKLCDDRTGAFGRTIRIDTTGRTTLTNKNVSCP